MVLGWEHMPRVSKVPQLCLPVTEGLPGVEMTSPQPAIATALEPQKMEDAVSKVQGDSHSSDQAETFR